MAAIRTGRAADLDAVAAVQAASPEAAQWDVKDYLAYDFRVAVRDNRLAGFLVSRLTGPGEFEILNLAVSPEFRRGGIARELLQSLLRTVSGAVFLEVRASNLRAIELYKSLGFQEISKRPAYYHAPSEAAIVLKFHSC